MGTTTNKALPYPDGGNAVVVHGDIKKLADKVDEQILASEEYKGLATDPGTVIAATRGVLYVDSPARAAALGLPINSEGWLTIRQTGPARRVTFETVANSFAGQRTFTTATAADGSWTSSTWVQDAPATVGVIGITAGGGTWKGLSEGTYLILDGETATKLGAPSPRPGMLRITQGTSGPKLAEYNPNDPIDGTVRSRFEARTRSDRSWGQWYRIELVSMRTAPVVLSLPSIESVQANPNQGWRSLFTVNRHTERARVHVRGRNWRAGQEWPINLIDMGIATRDRAGLFADGTMTKVPGAVGKSIPAGTEWVSDWFDVFMSPGNVYMLCLGATFPVVPVGLNNAWCYTTTSSGTLWDNNEEPRWGQVPFMPFEVWIEVEIPSNVLVTSSFGASSTMGMNLPDGIRHSYPQIHAQKHGAFVAHTAAGGWAVTDDSAWDLSVIDRFGDAGHCDDLYLAWGANELTVQGKTAQEIYDRLVLWLERIVSRIGSPRVHLMTVRARPGVSGPGDPVEIERAKLNKMIRYDPPALVTDVIDVAAVWDDPTAPWRRRPDVIGAAGPNDTHPSKIDQARWAQILDSGGGLPPVPPAITIAHDVDGVPYIVRSR